MPAIRRCLAVAAAFMKRMIGMFAATFFFLRHGETETNAAGMITGALDVRLTALGYAQAHAAARVLTDEPITAVYSSPLRRTRETAEPVAQVLRLPVTIIDELSERKRGQLEGQPRDASSTDEDEQGSERFEDFTARVLSGLSKVSSPLPLVVAHQGVFRVLCHTLDIQYTEGPISNALPLRFVPLETGWKIEALSIA
jgi:2,3-bisphosphoglycerate-dependent phosphoglycerate mutase